MPGKLLARENIWELHLFSTQVSDPGALPAPRAAEKKENACPVEAYRLGVAFTECMSTPIFGLPR